MRGLSSWLFDDNPMVAFALLAWAADRTFTIEMSVLTCPTGDVEDNFANSLGEQYFF